MHQAARPLDGFPHGIRARRWVAACLSWVLLAAAQAGEPVDGKVAAGTPVPRATTKIYRFQSGGTTSFSDRPPLQASYVVLRYDCFACDPRSEVDWHMTRLHLSEYADEINGAARRYHIDPALVRAVIHAESGFNARARSPKGAIGLMQLMPATARSLGVAHPTRPRDNIRGGVKYLADLLVQFKHDITLAAAAYNAGPQAVLRHAGVPPYPETQVYVQRVRILHQRYQRNPSL